MGSSEVGKSSKEGKEAKEPKTPASQAYSPMPPHGFMASSPQPHPYMWGVQQYIPPYGTPPHPYVMYPHGGIYAHPTMAPGSYPFSPYAMPSPNGIAEASGNTPGNMEVDGKSSEGKRKLPIKRSKGSLGSLNMITGKNNEPGKTSGPSGNGVHSKSAESASEGSSEGSDANSENDSQVKSGGRPDSEEPSQNGSAAQSSQNGGSHTSRSMVNQTVAMVPMQSQLWIQDERELKRQRRKQSNRESARRSRLRKQTECDELYQRSEALKEENASLRAQVARIKTEYEQLLAQNASLKERLGELPGQEDPRCGRDDQRLSSEAQ